MKDLDLNIRDMVGQATVIAIDKVENDITYITIRGHQYATVGSSIYPAEHPIVTTALPHIAKTKRDPEGIAEYEEMNEQASKFSDQILEKENEWIPLLIRKCQMIRELHGEETMIKFFNDALDAPFPKKDGWLWKEIERR